MRFKDRIYAIDDRVKIFFTYFYASGIVFLLVAFGLGLGFFELGVVLGLAHSWITEPLIANIKLGNKAEDIKVIARFKLAKNLLLSILICYFIAWSRLWISNNLIEFYFEPISFGLVYSIIHLAVLKIIPNKKLIKKTN